MGNVGGDPAAMTGGASDLHAAGQAVHAMEGHLSGQTGKPRADNDHVHPFRPSAAALAGSIHWSTGANIRSGMRLASRAMGLA